jgi:predicted DNA-binding transcriptional regulator YafY
VTAALYAAFRYLEMSHQIEKLSQVDGEGWLTVRLTTGSFEAARTRILGWGRSARVLEPRALRESIIDYAQQTLHTYDSSVDPC